MLLKTFKPIIIYLSVIFPVIIFYMFSAFNGACIFYNKFGCTASDGTKYIIINYFEVFTPLIKGAFGVYPWSIVSFFKSKGYKVTLTHNFKNADKVAKKNKANIVLYMHNKGMHYVAFKWKNSKFRSYNMSSYDYGYIDYDSVFKLLKAGRGVGIVLISIS